MSVVFTDEQYAIVARALVRIASDRHVNPNGFMQRTSREVMVHRARAACDAINLGYLGDGSGKSSFPDEIGLDRLANKSDAS